MADTSVVDPPVGRRGAPRDTNVAIVDEVRQKLSGASAAILTEYRGLTVADLQRLRRSLRAAGGEYKIYKNTLVRFATRELGIDGVEALLEGPTAIAFAAEDVPGVARALRDFSRTNPLLVVKGGLMGPSLLTPGDATALADIPSREVLLARLAGMLAAPMQQFAGALQALPRNLAYGLKALVDQAGGAPAEEEETAGVVAETAAEAPAQPVADVTAEPAASDVPADVTAEPAPEEAAAEAAVEVTDEPVAEEPVAEATEEPAPEPVADAPTQPTAETPQESATDQPDEGAE